ncbi:hypothetical protein GCM10007939_08860 [Amylibacter marinus]|uniref:Uncharacterized protein n=1 Tax=Amylibacter marinus TaxID=1475483 RepID=A0ABQ5VU17_9RHOB|nr:hypothetical protein [Amylibacter marinus]GLQ34603.1 hypothetical protein GCM10007939_08860 [Amylibacter marinus]
MEQNPKDPSVSVNYGSFSLSVSGYDDPFEMVQQVTKFYSQIAAENPHFGSQPVAADYTAPTDPAPKKSPDPAADLGPKFKRRRDYKIAHTEPKSKAQIWDPENQPKEVLLLTEAISSYARTDQAQIEASSAPLLVDENQPETAGETGGLSEKNDGKKLSYLHLKYPFRRFPDNK